MSETPRPPTPDPRTDPVEERDAGELELPDLLRCDDGGHPMLKRVALLAGAGACFVLGVVGWLVPIVTGIPFYILGLVLLAKGWPWAGHRVNAWERRLPRRWRLLLRPRWRAQHGHADRTDEAPPPAR